MSNILNSKSINDGGRFDGSSKMYGGMYFRGNSTATDMAGGDTWVAIGNNAPAHTVYGLVLTAAQSPYWEIDPNVAGTPTEDQTLKSVKCKASTLFTLHFGINAIVDDDVDSVIGIRVMRQQFDDPLPSPVVVTSTNLTTIATVLGASFSTSTLTAVDPYDAFWIEINNTGGSANVIITAASLIFTQ